MKVFTVTKDDGIFHPVIVAVYSDFHEANTHVKFLRSKHKVSKISVSAQHSVKFNVDTYDVSPKFDNEDARTIWVDPLRAMR